MEDTKKKLDAVYENPSNQPSQQYMAKLKKLQRRAVEDHGPRKENSMVIKINDGALIIEDNTIRSEGLKENCPYCQQATCYADCDGSQGDVDGLESEDQLIDRIVWNNSIDIIESLVLSLHMTGHDVSTPAFSQALQTTIDAMINHQE